MATLVGGGVAFVARGAIRLTFGVGDVVPWNTTTLIPITPRTMAAMLTRKRRRRRFR